MLTVILSHFPLCDFRWDLLREDVFLRLDHDKHFFFYLYPPRKLMGKTDKMSEIIKKNAGVSNNLKLHLLVMPSLHHLGPLTDINTNFITSFR